jgi:hypothetical protein
VAILVHSILVAKTRKKLGLVAVLPSNELSKAAPTAGAAQLAAL